jgi:hypothetical protein
MPTMSEDLPVIYHAANIGEADLIVHWLATRGFQAIVKDRYMNAALQLPQLFAPKGIEVCSLDPSQVDAAREALARYQLSRKEAAQESTGEFISAPCEHCGKSSEFPASQKGRVESCPHCGKTVDVPD